MNDFFPVACADTLASIGLLVKARRLSQGLRQSDLKEHAGVSEHTVRKIEAGSSGVDLRAFMLVLWKLGITDKVFAGLSNIESASEVTRFVHDGNPYKTLHSKRVRLPKPKVEDV